MSIIRDIKIKDKNSSTYTTYDIGADATNVKYDNSKNVKQKIDSLTPVDIGAIGISQIGLNGGVASLDNTGKVSSSQLPTMGTAAAKDVPASGNASSSQVVMGNDTRLSDARTANGGTADNVGHTLDIYDGASTIVESYDGTTKIELYFKRSLVSIDASNWSSTVDANGYYTNQQTLSSYFNTYAETRVRLIGSTLDTLPTAEQSAAYEMCDKFYMPTNRRTATLTVYAKIKPTTTFYVIVSGMYCRDI